MKQRAMVPLVLAGMAAGAGAFGQQVPSRLQIFGMVDVGVEHLRTSAGAATPAIRLTSVVNGPNTLSRIGFRGTEDLGGGLSASFSLEHGFDADTGANTAAVFFNRDAWVGIKGGLGEVRMGRTYTPGFWVIQNGDVNRYGWFANGGTFGRLTLSGQPRVDNGIAYISPSFGGLVFRVHWGAGAENTAPPRQAGRFLGTSAEYARGPLYVGAFHHRREDVFPANSTATAKSTYQGLTGRYAFAGFTLAGGLVEFDPAGPNTGTAGEQQGWWIGALTKVGAGEVRLNGGRLRTQVTAGPRPQATLLGASYNQPLSRRTNVYVAVGSMDNNQAGQFALESSSRQVAAPLSAGADTKAVTLGVRHVF